LVFNQIRKGRISDDILAQIKNAIFSGFYKAGDKLPSEQEMKKLFNVSRVPLREALRSLEEMGLVATKSGVSGGSFVAKMDIKPVSDSLSNMIRLGKIDFSDIWEFRMFIEPSISSAAAERRTELEIQQMEEMVLEREIALRGRKTPTISNIDFHLAIARAARNPFSILVLDTINDIYPENMKRFHISFKDWQSIIKYHREIIECIKKKENKKVKKVMYDHLKDTRRRLGI
jgi:GntR family transcriptional repressor for pyruvate dehydrogenase complex